jgi:hypothetical protein
MKNACRFSAGKLEGRGPFGRARRRWKYNIMMRLRK